jgi:6-phosphofructo-2-kinase/fructose-2,6-biphosphatase 2
MVQPGLKKTNGTGVQVEDTQICVVMVGLPARGKSLIAQKGTDAFEYTAQANTDWMVGAATRYLKWLSIPAKVFNVGNYRRNDTPQPTAEFFDTSNAEGERLRRAAAEAAVTDMINWFHHEGGVIGILDATNSTKERRKWIHERCEAEGIETLFVESKCDDEDLIMSNILEVKTTSPDYKGQDPEAAAQDFRNRIRNYEKVYQTIDKDEDSMTYLKIMNVGKQVIINRIQDYLQSRVVYYLMNLHIKPRSIWLSRVSPVLRPVGWLSQLTIFFSTVNPNSTSLASSAVMPYSHQTERNMPASYLSLSANPSA